ncbi:MAG: DUF2461 family protein [Actinomycetota bacterium]
MSDFAGFSKTGLDFLTTLGTKDKAWFDENRKVYDAEVASVAKAYVVAVGELLQDRMSPAIEAQPKTNGSIAPINNDLRFNPDASPYKDHLMFRFWEGPNKKTSAMLMVRVHPTDGVGFASGMNFADVNAWRDAVAADDSGAAIADAIHAVVAETGADVVGEGLKKVPKPFDPDHPRGDLLRHKGLQVRFIEKTPTRSVIGSAEFADWAVERLVRLGDIHHWLVANLV